MMDAPTNNDAIRSPSQIRHQLKQVLFRYLQRELRDNFKESPEACYHNHLTPIAGSVEKIGVCRYEGIVKEGTPRGKACDSRIGGCINMARACRFREPIRTKLEIREAFRTLMDSHDRGKIAAVYPDVAALMWVLDGVDVTEEVLLAEAEANPDQDQKLMDVVNE